MRPIEKRLTIIRVLLAKEVRFGNGLLINSIRLFINILWQVYCDGATKITHPLWANVGRYSRYLIKIIVLDNRHILAEVA